MYRHPLGLWCGPNHLVHTRRAFALVFRHPLDGKGFAAERVGQQALQGVHLAPSAFLRRLDDTRLKPTHVLVGRTPVNGVPAVGFVGGCTSRQVRRHLPCSLCRFFLLSRQSRPVGSQPACASGNVEPRIRPITRRHSLAPTSHTHIAIGSPCGVPTFEKERYGLTTFHVFDRIGLGRLFSPREFGVHDGGGVSPHTLPVPFW